MAVRVDGENGVVIRQFVVAILVTDDRSRGVRPSEATVTACFRRRRQQMEGAYGDLMCLVILNVLLLQGLFFSPLLQVLLLPFFLAVPTLSSSRVRNGGKLKNDGVRECAAENAVDAGSQCQYEPRVGGWSGKKGQEIHSQ